MTTPLQNKIDEAIDKADAEIMDWFFDVIKMNSMKLDVETIQNSTTLKEILKDVFSSITTLAQEEARKDVLLNLLSYITPISSAQPLREIIELYAKSKGITLYNNTLQ